MSANSYTKILKYKWQTIALFALVLVLLTVIFSLLQPLKYRSRVGLLVVQKQSVGLDAYAAARASERLAANLAGVIGTDSFFKKVLNSGFEVTNDWPSQESKRRKVWKKTVDAGVSPQSGILTINAYHPNKEQAVIISRAVAYVLTTQADQYHGAGDSVSIKVVDTPLASNYPVKPNLILNILAATFLGVFGASVMVLWQNKPGSLPDEGFESKSIDELVESNENNQNELENGFKTQIYQELENNI